MASRDDFSLGRVDDDKKLFSLVPDSRSRNRVVKGEREEGGRERERVGGKVVSGTRVFNSTLQREREREQPSCALESTRRNIFGD